MSMPGYSTYGSFAAGAGAPSDATATGYADMLSPVALCQIFGGASGAVRLPSATVHAGDLPAVGTFSYTASPCEVYSFGGGMSAIAAPFAALEASGHNSAGENSFACALPTPVLEAHGGANARLTCPTPALAISATVTGWGASALDAPVPSLSASGTTSGTAQATLALPSVGLIGYSGAVCSVTLTGRPTIQASGTTGSIAGAALNLPLFKLTSSGTRQNSGQANLLAPSAQLGATAQAWLMAPGATLTAIGSAVVAATYEAYAINLNHTPKPGVEPVDEATRYSRFPFTHIVRHKNSYYGVAADGLYLLEGTTDDGDAITYAVKTATTDFKSPYQKTVASAYLGGRLGPGATVTLHAGEGAQSQAYPYTTPRGALAQNYRQVFGKGIRHHRYYALGLSGTDVLELDNIELDTHQMTRRI